MALAEATITYDISDLVGADFDPNQTRVWVTTNVPGGAVIDTDGAQVRIGDGFGSLADDGTGSVSVWAPGDGSNPASWQTYIHVSYSPRYNGWRPLQRTFGPFTITEDTDLAYLVAEQEVPPTYLSQVTAELQAMIDQGLQGPTGPQGPAGANGGSDASTADNLANGTATKAALATQVTTAGAFKTALDGKYAPVTSAILGNRFAVTGDSITAANCDQTNGLQADSWATHVALASAGSLQHVGNFGHGGYTTAQLLALFQSEVLAASPNVVGIFGGTNDNLNGANNKPTDTATNIKAMVALARAAGARPFLGTIAPQGMAALATPAAPTLTQDPTNGTLTAATYSYRVVAKNAVGQTLASTAATIVVSTGTTNQVNIEAPFVEGANAYAFYGRVGGSELLIGTNTTGGGQSVPSRRFTDTGSVIPAGALPGSNTTAQAYNSTAQLKIAAVNNWIRRYGSANQIPVVDMHSVLVDPVTGLYKTGYTADGTHPTSTAQRRMGALAWATISALVPVVSPPITRDNANPTNLLPNGCFITGSANLPTGWSSYAGYSTGYSDTLGAKTGFLGQALTSARTVSDARFHDSAAFTTGYSVGDRLAVIYKLQTESCETGGLSASYTVRANGANKDIVTLRLSAADVGPAIWAQEFVVPASTTGLYIKGPYLAFGTGSASLGQVTIINLTTGGVLAADL